MDKSIDVLTKLGDAGYSLSESKCELFKTEIEWIGHKIDQNGIRPLQNELLAIKALKKPENEKVSNFWVPSNTCPNILIIFPHKPIS